MRLPLRFLSYFVQVLAQHLADGIQEADGFGQLAVDEYHADQDGQQQEESGRCSWPGHAAALRVARMRGDGAQPAVHELDGEVGEDVLGEVAVVLDGARRTGDMEILSMMVSVRYLVRHLGVVRALLQIHQCLRHIWIHVI